MKPLSDRAVIVALIAAVGICFALAFWTVRLNPGGEPPLQWRQGPSVMAPAIPVPALPT